MLDVLARTISGDLHQFLLADVLDILIIAILLYQLILLTKETRAYQVLKGIAQRNAPFFLWWTQYAP